MNARRTLPWLGLALLGACAHASSVGFDRALRVMTYNIAAGNGNLNSILSVVRAAGADVVALQEVDVHWHTRSAFADQATALGMRLGMQVRFAPIYRPARRRCTCADAGTAGRDQRSCSAMQTRRPSRPSWHQ